MDVNYLNVSASYSQTLSITYKSESKTEKPPENKDSKTDKTASETPAVSVELSKDVNNSANDGNNYKIDRAQVQKMLDDANKQTEAFVEMMKKMFAKQGKLFETSSLKLLKDIGSPDAAVKVDEETRAWAEKEISEDGYYGAKQTSERILGFAKALAGGDPSKIETLKQAVIKGFEAAAGALGLKDASSLPDVCKQTYDAVMKGFDEWETN